MIKLNYFNCLKDSYLKDGLKEAFDNWGINYKKHRK